MCHFVTLIAPSDDAAAIDALMRQHDRRATPIGNSSVAAQLHGSERQYLTTVRHCDCGTILARRHHMTAEEFDAELLIEAEKRRRKKWSDAKIARWIEDRRKAKSKPSGGGSDSIEQWALIVRALKDELGLSSVGLFVHFYHGSISDERFEASRRDADPKLPLHAQLESMEEDQVTIFT